MRLNIIRGGFKIYYLIIIFSVFNFSYINSLKAQEAQRLNSAEVFHKMEKLNVVGSVLYVAAHPDDENTRLLSYLSNEKKLYTTYISLTRGDGGQNLLGPEIGPVMGVLRTQELLEARKIEGTHQLFSRANDFGFSKNGEETLEIWDQDGVTKDMVWAYRMTQPDIVINRFDHRTSGRTHGHHTASALIAIDAFDKSGDKTQYPDQLKFTTAWQPQRFFYNTSWWAYGSQEAFDKADKTNFVTQEIGVYYPYLGESNSDIGARARSMHKCQGFGSTGSRGSAFEYLELVKGDLPQSKSDILDGINTSWTRLKGGEKVEKLVKELLEKYDFKRPEKSVTQLAKIYQAIERIEDVFWKKIKQEEVVELLLACGAVYTEARTSTHKIAPGDQFTVEVEFSQERSSDIKLIDVTGLGQKFTIDNSESKIENVWIWKNDVTLPAETPYTLPYWLWEKGTLGMLSVPNQQDVGKPMTDKTIKFNFVIDVEGIKIPFEKELIHKYNDTKRGATYRPLAIIPALSVKPQTNVVIFADNKPQTITVSLHAWTNNIRGTLTIPTPRGWKITPEKIDFSFDKKDATQDFIFTMTPPGDAQEITITPIAKVGDKSYDGTLIDIIYDHIPYQVVRMPADIKVSRLNIQNHAKKVAYIMGAGDDIPQSLRNMGCHVDIVQPEQLTSSFLKDYDALIMGVRAYNTIPELKYKQDIIFDYISNGGNVMVQYNVNRGLVTPDFSPYSITLSRSRVTEEDSEVRIINPTHPAFNSPNKIAPSAFDGWVQERGLYYPEKWDDKFSTLISSNDKNEAPLDGGILVAPYGKGHFIYTGISFFRQLPAGVPGAYLLFANLISMGKNGQ